ncbi:MAG: sialidase family protein [Pirellulales bacterium]
MMRSSDNGHHWSWPQVLLDGPIDDRDAGVCVTETGTILVTTFSSLAYEGILEKAARLPQETQEAWPSSKLFSWNAVHARISDERRTKELGVWMIRSENGGTDWSGRYRVPVNSPHGPVCLSDGSLLYAGVALWSEERRVGVCRSTDDGQSWQWLADMPVRPGDSSLHYHELHAVEASDGRLVVQLRNHNATNKSETLQSESIDRGHTWSQPHSIDVWGLPSHLVRLRDDRLLMTYGHRRSPFGIQARLSNDCGKTWSDPMILYGDGASGDLGYPSTVQLDGKMMVTVWYELPRKSSHAVLRQARWTLSQKE